MHLGYNTNGFAFHRLADAIEIIAELGYRGVAITVDHHALNPYADDADEQMARVREQLGRLRLRSVIETGARFLLDPWHKHQPTLISQHVAQRRRRIDFLQRCVRLAAALGADAVSFWSGAAADDADHATLRGRLLESLWPIIEEADRAGVRLAFEPEPGMFIATVADALPILETLHHPFLGLTIDVGHLHCQSEGDIPTILQSAAKYLYNVHLEDMKPGAHDHLRFGEGAIEFAPIIRKLTEIGYAGGCHVELSRHSHDAVETARQSLQFLNEQIAWLGAS